MIRPPQNDRKNWLSSPPSESSVSAARHRLGHFSGLGVELRASRYNVDEMDRLTARPAYQQLMIALRHAAVMVRANPDNDRARGTLEYGARLLDVPVIDLEQLARIPTHMVANGGWRPRSYNVDLVEPDASTKIGPETKVQAKLNEWSSHLPETKTYRSRLLHPLYWMASKSLPTIDRLGRLVTIPTRAVQRIIKNGGDKLASDLQTKLRDIRKGCEPANIDFKDLKGMNELEQRMFLMSASGLSEMTLDAEAFIEWTRDPKKAVKDKRWSARIKSWTSAGMETIANFVGALADGTEKVTRADGWRTMSTHVQVGGGIEKWWVSSRLGVTIMYPTIEQFEREGKVDVKLVPRVNPLDSLFLGMTLTSRGGGLSFKSGLVGAKVSEFEHELKAGIPGIIGVSVGEDYSYGPVVAFGYSPPIGGDLLAALPFNVRAGGEIKFYHSALAGMSRPTRKAAEGLSIGVDETQRSIARGVRKIRGIPEQEPGQSEEWPTSQRWQLIRRMVNGADTARRSLADRIEHIETIGPLGFVENLTDKQRELLAGHAEDPYEALEIIDNYVRYLDRKLEVQTRQLRRHAAKALNRKHVNSKTLKKIKNDVRRSVSAFEYIDTYLLELFDQEVDHAEHPHLDPEQDSGVSIPHPSEHPHPDTPERRAQ